MEYKCKLDSGEGAQQEVLDQALTRLNEYQRKFQRCGDVILQTTGVGLEYNCVEGRLERVREVVKYAEEMLCEAMEDPMNLVLAHTTGSLSYQSQDGVEL